MIYRVAEAIAVGIAAAKALGWLETATLGFMFRWRKLKDAGSIVGPILSSMFRAAALARRRHYNICRGASNYTSICYAQLGRSSHT